MKLTDAELEILQVLWKHGEGTVRFVNDEISKNRKVGYTSTLKIMQIMTEKGLLERKMSLRSHVYIPIVSEKEAKGALVGRLIKKAFDGSAAKLVMQALGNHSASHEELAEIKKLINQLEKEKP